MVCDTPEDLEEKLSAGGSLELTAKAAPEAAEAVLDPEHPHYYLEIRETP